MDVQKAKEKSKDTLPSVSKDDQNDKSKTNPSTSVSRASRIKVTKQKMQTEQHESAVYNDYSPGMRMTLDKTGDSELDINSNISQSTNEKPQVKQKSKS